MNFVYDSSQREKKGIVRDPRSNGFLDRSAFEGSAYKKMRDEAVNAILEPDPQAPHKSVQKLFELLIEDPMSRF